MPQILRNLRVREVSSVNRGAGEDVKVMLMKRDFTEAERRSARGHAMPDGSFPIESAADVKNAVQAIGRAKDPAAVKAHIKRRAKALGCTNLLPADWVGKALEPFEVTFLPGVSEELLAKSLEDERFVAACRALGKSTNSIFDSEIGVDAGIEALSKTLDQFATHVAGFAPEVVTAMKRGAEPMVTLKDQLQKAFGAATDAEKDTFRKELEGNIATLETSKAALETANTALQEQVGKSNADAEIWKTRALKAVSLEKAAKDYKNHPDNTMDDEETCKFLDMSESERGEYMKAHPIEVMTQKRMDSLPEPVRKQLAEGQAAAVQVQKMQEEREVESFAKSASDLGQSTEFGAHLRVLAKGIGTAEERTAAFDAITKALEASAKQARTAGLFKEFGSRQNGSRSARDELMAKANELREAVSKSGNGKSLTSDQAFTKVYTDPANRDLVVRYRAEISKQSTVA